MKLYGIAISITLFLATAQAVYAQEDGCRPIYGGGETCLPSQKVTVNKTVQNPITFGFVEELSTKTPFSPNQTIMFKITAANKDAKTVENIKAKDVLPPYVVFVQGPGTFDQKTNTFSFTIDRLGKDQSKDTFVTGRIVGPDKLPQDQNSVCIANQVRIESQSKTSQDNTQFCIQRLASIPPPSQTKGGLPVGTAPQNVYATPSTGSQSLLLIAFAASALSGWFLRQIKAKI